MKEGEKKTAGRGDEAGLFLPPGSARGERVCGLCRRRG